MRNIPEVHSWINTSGHVQHIGHHLNAGVFKQGLTEGKKRTKEENEALKNEKIEFKANAKYGPLALRLGEADGVSGGTSDTGNNAKEFIHPKNREMVLDLYEFKSRRLQNSSQIN